MTKKRKHRLVVDITLEEPCTEREAINELRYDLNCARLGSRIVREAVTVWNVKSFTRVITAFKVAWVAKALRNYHGTSVRETLDIMQRN